MENPKQETAPFDHFASLDIRVGTLIEVRPFPEARKPAYQLSIDFGPMGVLKSSAQITALYSLEDLKGKQVIAVVNFENKRIAGFKSECLVLGIYGEDTSEVTLLCPERPVPNGSKIG
ncbi:tRNA-binding protein [bacterium SCSIO 12741]|nr:tRNA-binding protein [bacterium SCSIO 12741]